MSSSDFLTALLFFARTSGFFLISPLFSKVHIPKSVRFGFAALCALVLIPPLSLKVEIEIESSLFWIAFVKELAIGYLLGFLFSLIFEAVALAGQVVGTLSGFSLTELFGAGMNDSIFTKLFVLTLFALFLSLDLHHLLLKFLFESFDTVPLLPNGFSFTKAASLLFEQAIFYAFTPFLFLTLLLLTFAVIARALPDLQIFWIGFPLQLFVSMIAIAMGLTFFEEILQKAFFEFLTLAKTLFFPL